MTETCETCRYWMQHKDYGDSVYCCYGSAGPPTGSQPDRPACSLYRARETPDMKHLPPKPAWLPENVSFNWYSSIEKDAVVCVCRVDACEATGTVSHAAWRPGSASFNEAMSAFQDNLYRSAQRKAAAGIFCPRCRSMLVYDQNVGWQSCCCGASFKMRETSGEACRRSSEARAQWNTWPKRADACGHSLMAADYQGWVATSSRCRKCGKKRARDVGPWKEAP